jgi:diguanylate cyclase (GGDEF)-like protein/PAS domain S-box-containing protein
MNQNSVDSATGPAMLEWARRILLTADDAGLCAEIRAAPAALLPTGWLEYVPASADLATPTPVNAADDAVPADAGTLSVAVNAGGSEAGRLVLHGAARTPDADTLLANVSGFIEAVLARRDQAAPAEKDIARENPEAFFEQLFAAAPEAIAVLDTEDRIVRTNRAFQELFGYPLDELIGRTINEVIVPQEMQDQALELTHRVASGGYVREDTIRRRRDGSLVHVSILATPIIVQGDQVAVYGMYRDITAHKETEETLRRLSTTDELTGLFNRRGFFLLAEQQRRVAIRKRAELLLLYIDIDDFKTVNDTYGHVAGDRVLADIGALLQSCYRESDIIARVGEEGGLLARMGGDEFVVLAMDPGAEGERILTQRLRDRLAEYNASSAAPCDISLSIGAVRMMPDPHSSIDLLIAAADDLMYADKRHESTNP